MEEFNTMNEVYKCPNLLKKFITRHDITSKFMVFKSIDAYLNIGKENKFLHEVILSEKPRKFFVDLDGKDISKDMCDTHVKHITQIIVKLFARTYSIILSKSDIIIVDSSGEVEDGYKFSINIVIDNHAFVDYAEFKWFGDQVAKDYYSWDQNIPNFLDMNFFNRAYIDSYISARLPGCTKANQARFKLVTSGQDQDRAIISYTRGCNILHLKSGIDRTFYRNKLKMKKSISVEDPEILDMLNITKHLWSGSFTVRSTCVKNGSICISFDRFRPSHCTICNEVHHKDSSFGLIKTPSGLYEKCRQKTSEWSLIMANNSYNTPVQQKEYVKLPRENKVRELIYDEMFPKNKNVYLIKAEMKMGKTKKCIEYIETEAPKTVILLSFRRTFSAEMHAKYKDFELYSEIKSKLINIDLHPKIIIQVESLHRIMLSNMKIDLLILDEIESIWSQFSSGNLVDYYGITSMFSYLLRTSKKIIAMDANLHDRTMRLMQYVRPDSALETHYYVNRYNPSQDYKYYIVSKAVMYCMIIKHIDANKKIMIMSNSITETIELYELVKKHNKNLRIGLYNSRTKESKKMKHFRNIHQYWSQYDVVICSPTVSAGISFELEYFDYLFGSFNSMSCNVETCRQMLGRIRNVKSKIIYLHLEGDKREHDLYPTSPDEIKRHMKLNRTKLLNDAKGFGIEVLNFEININGDLEFYDSFPYQLVAENIAFENRSKNNFSGLFISSLRKLGFTLNFISEPEQLELTTGKVENMRGIMTENTSNVKTKKIEKIHKAENISDEQVADIKDRIRKAEDISKRESFALEKYKIRNVTKLDDPSEDMIKAFIKPGVLKQLIMCRSLLTNSREDDTKYAFDSMQKYVLSGALLGDALTSYKSVTNKLFTELFESMPFAIKIPDLFIGTNQFIYIYENDTLRSQDIADYWKVHLPKTRQLVEQLLMNVKLDIPIVIKDLNHYELFDVFKRILIVVYGLSIGTTKCSGNQHIVFSYRDKYYKGGKPFNPNNISKYPVVLIKE